MGGNPSNILDKMGTLIGWIRLQVCQVTHGLSYPRKLA